MTPLVSVNTPPHLVAEKKTQNKKQMSSAGVKTCVWIKPGFHTLVWITFRLGDGHVRGRKPRPLHLGISNEVNQHNVARWCHLQRVGRGPLTTFPVWEEWFYMIAQSGEPCSWGCAPNSFLKKLNKKKKKINSLNEILKKPHKNSIR